MSQPDPFNTYTQAAEKQETVSEDYASEPTPENLAALEAARRAKWTAYESSRCPACLDQAH